MEPALSTRIPDGFMAALRLGGEKPHQGVRSQNPAPNQVREVCNFTVLLGLQAAAVLNRVGSRSTGKERDTESGNDYFGARYYASSMGRFMSPDWSAQVEPVPYSKLGDPQSLNLYAYVYNNPITGVDPDGHQLASPDRWGCQANEPGCQNNSNDNAATKTNALNAYISGGGVGMRPGEARQNVSSDARTDIMLFAGSSGTGTPLPLNSASIRPMGWEIVPNVDTLDEVDQFRDPGSHMELNTAQMQAISARKHEFASKWVRLLESNDGKKEYWTDKGQAGSGSDQIYKTALPVWQKWYVDGKRVQLVIGDSKGSLQKAWTVKVTWGDNGNPHYDKVD
jgi:RHS repeat-associated protein